MGNCLAKGKIGPSENANFTMSAMRRPSHLRFSTNFPIWYQDENDVVDSIHQVVLSNLSKWRSIKQRFVNPNEIVYFFKSFVQLSPYIDGLVVLDPCYSLASYDRVSLALILKQPIINQPPRDSISTSNLKKSGKIDIENNVNTNGHAENDPSEWSDVKKQIFDDILTFISDILIHQIMLNGKLYLYVSPTPDLYDEFAVPQIIRVEVMVLRNAQEFQSVSMLMSNTIFEDKEHEHDDFVRTSAFDETDGLVSLWDTYFTLPSNDSVLIDKNSNIKRSIESMNCSVEKKEKTLEREIMYLSKKFILNMECASADHGRGDRIRYLHWLNQAFQCIVSMDCLLDNIVEASHMPLSMPLQAYRRLYPNRISGYPSLEPRGDLKGATEKKRSYLIKFMDLMDEAGSILGFSDVQDYEFEKSDEKKQKEKEASLEFASAVDVEEGAELIPEMNQTKNETLKKRSNEMERSEEDNIKSKQWWAEMNSAVRLLDLVIQRDHYENLRDCSSCDVTLNDLTPINGVETLPPRGGVVRPNVLFRAASLHTYTTQELQKLFTHFNIQTVIDLRTEKDIRSKPYIDGLFSTVISPFAGPTSRKARTFTNPSLLQATLPNIPHHFPKDSGMIYINIPIVPYTTLRLPPQLQMNNASLISTPTSTPPLTSTHTPLPPLHATLATRTFSSPNILPLQNISPEIEQNESDIDPQQSPEILSNNTSNSQNSPKSNNSNSNAITNNSNINNNNSSSSNNVQTPQNPPLIYGPQSGEPFDRNWAFYEIFPRYSKDEISLVFRTLGTAPWPVILHCSEGRDRTGCLVAMLLLLGGCTPDQVRLDYLSSGKFTQPHSILTTIKVIEEYGGIYQYLSSYIGVSAEHLALIKERLSPIVDNENGENDLNITQDFKNSDSPQASPSKKWKRKNSKSVNTSPRSLR
eukprot:TRINITY_DN1468_c0_g1_i1.p1 TRINITY_DN1468_c0_g1~~TRINITY_DN1468_c0_g1_i1.p1  ORF type:complete len:921 (-),score=189.49 TRINITY_DN1468_c0_g1_i1:37-2799(-)